MLSTYNFISHPEKFSSEKLHSLSTLFLGVKKSEREREREREREKMSGYKCRMKKIYEGLL